MRIFILLTVLGLLGACNPSGPVKDPSDKPLQDFSLLDVNETSLTYNKQLSPRDYLEHISAWYFGHAT